jgi:hypothetical protein
MLKLIRMIVHLPRSALYLALLVIALSVAHLFHRLSLPADGWSYARDTTGVGSYMKLERSLSGQPSTLNAGDVLLAVEDQPVSQMLEGALTLNPHRPSGWKVGGTVHYTVERYGHTLTVPVDLARLPAGRILLNVGRNLLLNPAPLLMVLIAFFVYFRDPLSSPARLLLLFSAAVFSSDGVSQAVSASNVLSPAELFYRSGFWPAQVVNSLIWPFIIGPVFIHLLLSFPVTRVQLRRFRTEMLAVMYGFMPLLTILIAIATGGQALSFWLAWNRFSFIDFVLVLVAAIGIMAYTLLTTRDPTGRAQVRWLASGAILTSLGALLGSVAILLRLSGLEMLLAWTATRLMQLSFPVAVAIAILRYRLFEIDLIIHNTVVYGVLSALLGGIYVVSVVLLEFVFRFLTGQQSSLAIVLSTLTIAALFVPLRRRVQTLLDRRMYHHKYDAEQAISSFSATVRDEVDLDEISARVVGTVEETMQPKDVSLWLRPLGTSRHEQP